jgi:glyoxylase-like metal-dependent hydrolase (beta-lactamase superfamily II)
VTHPPPARPLVIGEVRVTPVLDSEGPFFLPLHEAFPTMDDALLAAASRVDPPRSDPGSDDTWHLPFRAFVVEARELVVLVDTGAASDTAVRRFWAPLRPDHLADRLPDLAGVTADQVTHVVLTHLHADHAAGSIDAEGRPAFRHAQYLVQAEELAALAASGADRSLWTALVDPMMGSDQLRACHGDVELAPGPTSVRLLPTPGHTPGHQSLLVESGGRSALVGGDVFLHAAQLIDPTCRYAFDADDELAVATRRRLLEILRAGDACLGTAHLGQAFIRADALP